MTQATDYVTRVAGKSLRFTKLKAEVFIGSDLFSQCVQPSRQTVYIMFINSKFAPDKKHPGNVIKRKTNRAFAC